MARIATSIKVYGGNSGAVGTPLGTTTLDAQGAFEFANIDISGQTHLSIVPIATVGGVDYEGASSTLEVYDGANLTEIGVTEFHGSETFHAGDFSTHPGLNINTFGLKVALRIPKRDDFEGWFPEDIETNIDLALIEQPTGVRIKLDDGANTQTIDGTVHLNTARSDSLYADNAYLGTNWLSTNWGWTTIDNGDAIISFQETVVLSDTFFPIDAIYNMDISFAWRDYRSGNWSPDIAAGSIVIDLIQPGYAVISEPANYSVFSNRLVTIGGTVWYIS